MNERTTYERRWWSLAVLCMTLLVITLDNTILNVAIPSLVKDLQASTSQLQWVIDGYTLVFAGLLLTMGSIGDRFGRKGALMVGLTIFGTGSMLSGLATSANMLTITRASMGIGAALIMPATLSLLTNIFHDPRERGRAIGAWAAVAGASGALGPVIGGLLLKHFSWGSIFFVNVPVIIVALIAGKFLLPSSRDPDAPRLDLIGAALSIAGLVALLWAIIEAPARGWGDPAVVSSLLAGLLILAAFVTWELRSSHPMLDVRFFKNRRFTAANIAITLVFFAMFGQMFLGTQYLQTVLGYSALEAGLRMMPMALVMVALAPVAPRMVERVGTKLVVGTGLIIVTGGLLVVATVPVTNGYPHLLVGFCLVSTGMALVMAPATESIMGSLPPSKAGVGSAMNDTTRQMGGALGVAVLGSIFATVFRPGLAKGALAAGLTPSQLARAKDSLGGALEVAGELPARTAAQLTAVAKTEFVNGMQAAVLVAAAVVVVAAVVVFAYLPARAHDAREAIERQPSDDVLDGLASLTYAEAEGVLELDAANAIALDGVHEVGVGAPVPARGSVAAEAGAKR